MYPLIVSPSLGKHTKQTISDCMLNSPTKMTNYDIIVLQEKRIVYFHIQKKQEVLVKKVSEDELVQTNPRPLKYPHTQYYYTTECTCAHSRVRLYI